MADSIPRPGVQVIQQFRAQSPTVITPQLVPCIVGVCKQIVELLVSDGAGGQLLNPDALIELPAFFISKDATGDPPVYTGLDGLILSVSINNSPAVQVTFADPSGDGLTPATVVGQINDAFLVFNVSSAKAILLDENSWQLATIGKGQFQSIYIDSLTAPIVGTTFGIGIGQTYVGLNGYSQFEVVIPPEAFPDPRGNLTQLAFEQDSIKVYLALGGGQVQEATRSKSFLRNGLVDDPAVVETTLPAITYPTDLLGTDLVLNINGEDSTYTFPAVGASPADADELAQMLNAGFAGVGVVHDTGVLYFSTELTGAAASLTVVSGSAVAVLGLTLSENQVGLSIKAIDDGNGDATTSLLEFDSEDFTLAATQGVMTAGTVPDFALITAGSTLILSDGQTPQEVVFTGSEVTVVGVADSLQASIEAIVGTAVGGRIVVSDDAGKLVLTNVSRFGDESLIKIIGGTALPGLDQGTDNAITPEGSQTLNPSTAAVSTEGSVDLTVIEATSAGETFDVFVDGGGAQVVSLGANPGDHTDLPTFIAYLDGQITGATLTQGGALGALITSDTTGSTSSIQIVENTGGAAALGLTVETVVGVDIFPTLGVESFTINVDDAGDEVVTLASDVTFAALKATIEGQVAGGNGVTVTQGPDIGGLVFTGGTPGLNGTIVLTDTGGALALLGVAEQTAIGSGEIVAAGASERGRVHPPLPGDKIYIDGVEYANVNQVAPGGAANRLKIDRQVVIQDNVGARWFIQALDLDGPNSIQRPSGDLQLDLNNNVTVKHSLLRDFSGEPIDASTPLYMSYSAVRRDTSPLAEDPGILTFDDTLQLEAAIAPISTANPLALGTFLALVNAPGIQITALGVDSITADSPDGTVEAYTRAVEYLEGHEVYALAPLTHDETVAQVFNTHVNFMSEPEQRGERIVMWNPETPTTELDALVASGTNGDGLNTFTFDTKVTNLSALLQNAGVSPVGTITADKGAFLDISLDNLRYSIKAVNGSQITVRVDEAEFASGVNDDNFYAESNLPSPLIGELFSIRVRGKALVTIDGAQDKNAVAATVNQLGASFGNRRFWLTFPDKCRATIEGLEQIIEGYYMNAASAGCIGQQPPQQSFTNFPIAGFTGVVGSNDTFSEAQLDTMAGGGAWIFIQEGQGTPIFSRMALTTDTTSIETRTDSVNKVVDFTAKFMRSALKNYIGRFNITQGFLDTLGTTVQGLFGFLVETSVLIGGQLDNIIQDEDNRDTVLIDTTIDVPIPCNYIKLTLLI